MEIIECRDHRCGRPAPGGVPGCGVGGRRAGATEHNALDRPVGVALRVGRWERVHKAQETHRRIVEAATRLFLERRYVATTIDAIAEAADVAVETVYARFRNKTNLMIAVKDAAVTEGGQVPLDQRPELASLATEDDQRRQILIAAALSRTMLERISPVYALLRDAAAADESLHAHLAAEIERRRAFQRAPVELIRAHGRLRGGLTTDQAADTYSGLANPDCVARAVLKEAIFAMPTTCGPPGRCSSPPRGTLPVGLVQLSGQVVVLDDFRVEPLARLRATRSSQAQQAGDRLIGGTLACSSPPRVGDFSAWRYSSAGNTSGAEVGHTR
jgi:AcrR family transcriptional regulator